MKQIQLSVTMSHQRKIHLSHHQFQVLWGRGGGGGGGGKRRRRGRGKEEEKEEEEEEEGISILGYIGFLSSIHLPRGSSEHSE